MFVSLGRSRQSLLDSHRFSMPRVEVQSKFRAPARAGQIVRVGIRTTVENPRRLHHAFEIRDDESNAPARRRLRARRVRRLRVVVAARSARRRAAAGLGAGRSRRAAGARIRRVAMDVAKPPLRPRGAEIGSDFAARRARHRAKDQDPQQALLPGQSLADLDFRVLHRAGSADVRPVRARLRQRLLTWLGVVLLGTGIAGLFGETSGVRAGAVHHSLHRRSAEPALSAHLLHHRVG